jgi:glycyl-tRNA synthetase
MADVQVLQARITKQQSVIKQMKKDKAADEALAAEQVVLAQLREELAAAPAESYNFNRRGFDELILRKMYVVPSFEIHNGPAGLYDLGPPACALKNNIVQRWRLHFPQEDNMLEMECTNLTPQNVLATSGHVERFTDFMVKDEVTSECFRADVLLEDGIDALLAANPTMPKAERDAHLVVQRQADAFTVDELAAMLVKYEIKSPAGKDNLLSKPYPFNLMFTTNIGPAVGNTGFLRPETAQGLFVNFRRLLDYNQSRMPFAAAQIGLGFRNEISPKNGLLRVREFTMAEIEHFVNPNDKSHPKFASLASTELILFPADAQLSTGQTVTQSIGEAVNSKLVDNETLGYFMARTQLFLEKIGVDPHRMRFRQHLRTEMAHYATDCWDVEIKMSYGWIECVGHADRACYDLEMHGKATGSAMTAAETLPEPVTVIREIAEPVKKLLGPRFKGDQKLVMAAIMELEGDAFVTFKKTLEATGKATLPGGFEITPELVTFSTEKKTTNEIKFTPSVIEPSFGIGRVLYAVMEHAFTQRDGDEQRCVMRFRPNVAPIKVGIFPLLRKPEFDPVVESLRTAFNTAGLASRVDASAGSVGRRYSRADELGVPFGITVDFESLFAGTVTLRDRDSMAQIRVDTTEAVDIISRLCAETISFPELMKLYIVVNDGGDEGADEGADAQPSQAKPMVLEKHPRAMFFRPNPDFKA